MEKKTILTLDQVKEIEKTYPTPFHIYDEKGIRENAKAVKEAFAWNKGYREYFAVKATPNPYKYFLLDLSTLNCIIDTLFRQVFTLSKKRTPFISVLYNNQIIISAKHPSYI